MARLIARVRLPIQYLGSVLSLLGFVAIVLDVAGVTLGPWPLLLLGPGVVLLLLAALLSFVSPAAGGPASALAPPVRGRWQAVNSPTGKVPSHGTHAYGQTYAVDLVFLPPGERHPEFGKEGRGFLPPDRFPAFGQDIHAPADGVVVRRFDRARDHLSRSSWGAYAYMVLESVVRELRGPAGVLGNHLVLRLEDGTHFVLAHLQRGSLRVRPGATVRAGEVIARVGNSGNTSEPHLHCQRQDLAATVVALGLPWTIRGAGIPAEGETADY